MAKETQKLKTHENFPYKRGIIGRNHWKNGLWAKNFPQNWIFSDITTLPSWAPYGVLQNMCVRKKVMVDLRRDPRMDILGAWKRIDLLAVALRFDENRQTMQSSLLIGRIYNILYIHMRTGVEPLAK